MKEKRVHLSDLGVSRDIVFSGLGINSGGLGASLVWQRDATQVEAAEIHGDSDLKQTKKEMNIGYDGILEVSEVWDAFLEI